MEYCNLENNLFTFILRQDLKLKVSYKISTSYPTNEGMEWFIPIWC